MLGGIGRLVYQSTGFIGLTCFYLSPAFLFSFSKQTHNTAKKFVVKWAAGVQKLLEIKLHVDDRRISNLPQSSNRGSLYVHLNQQTLLSMVLYTLMFENSRPVCFVMNYEFALIPLVGWTQYMLGGFSIVRENPLQAKRMLNLATSRLREGGDVGISIEGRRCDPDGSLSPYKKGPVVMAIEAQCDIIPFMTLGEMKIWPHNSYSVIPGGTVNCVIFHHGNGV